MAPKTISTIAGNTSTVFPASNFRVSANLFNIFSKLVHLFVEKTQKKQDLLLVQGYL